jgi:hypothetical protein
MWVYNILLPLCLFSFGSLPLFSQDDEGATRTITFQKRSTGRVISIPTGEFPVFLKPTGSKGFLAVPRTLEDQVLFISRKTKGSFADSLISIRNDPSLKGRERKIALNTAAYSVEDSIDINTLDRVVFHRHLKPGQQWKLATAFSLGVVGLVLVESFQNAKEPDSFSAPYPAVILGYAALLYIVQRKPMRMNRWQLIVPDGKTP